MITTELRNLYREATGGMLVGETAKSRLRAARIVRKWRVLEDLGYVQLRAEWDDSYSPNDYDPPEPAGTVAYGSIGEYRLDTDSDHWKVGDSVWGHTGYRDVLDWKENVYIVDIMEETIDAFAVAWRAMHVKRRDLASGRCPHCHGTGRS